MFCPSCGIQILNEQKYCRACGMELEPVAALVASRGTLHTSFKPSKSDQEIAFRTVKLITAGVIIFFLGAIISLAGRRLFNREDIGTVGVFVLFSGLITTVFALFQGLWAKTMPRPTRRSDPTTQPDLDSPSAAHALPGTIPSITESTTRIIDEDPQPASDHRSS